MKKQVLFSIPKSIMIALAGLLLGLVAAQSASAQCSVTAAPTYANSCSSEYYDSISATGAGVSSTISVAGITSCIGTYINDYATQGILAPAGSAIALGIGRYTSHYVGHVSVYVDWNNDGTYQPTELVGTAMTMSGTTLAGTYNFTVPSTGAVTGTRLHMRVMLSEGATGAPCNGTYGQTYDFFLEIGTGCITPVLTFSPSSHDTVSNCAGGRGVKIRASGAGVTGTFTWSPATGLSASTGGVVVANPSANTVYTVTATTTGTCTATYYDSVAVISTGLPADTIFYTLPASFCPGGSYTLSGTSGIGYTYQWFLDGSAVSYARSQYYTITAGGSYTLVINAYGCVDTSAAVVMSVYPVIVPAITQTGKTFHTGSHYSDYIWLKNGTIVTGVTADSLVATASGTYNVVVTDSNGCSDTSGAYAYSNVGVASLVNAAGIAIYPNPATGIINIIAPVAVNAIMTAMDGKIVVQQKAAQRMDVSYLAPGMYFIELFDENGHKLATQRIIKN